MKKNRYEDERNKPEKYINLLYLGISICAAIALWILISSGSKSGKVFASPEKVWKALLDRIESGILWLHWWASLRRVLLGFSIAFCASVPFAFLIGWYKPFRLLVHPWIRFIRCIPPLSFIPLVVVAAGIGERAKIIVIFIAAFLNMVVAIYGGVVNVDNTLIKAARVLGANDRTIFFNVVIPFSLPYIIVGVRLGLASSLTVLVAAELTGAQLGLGQMIQEASAYFKMDVILMGIIVIGISGLVFEQIVNVLERKLTAWQEVRAC
jgi:NitT/TauT family transport system permease protein